MEFWWQPYITDNGLIQDGSKTMDFLDLWDEIESALQDIDSWELSNGTTYSYYDLIQNISQQIFRLSECERISLWGLAI